MRKLSLLAACALAALTLSGAAQAAGSTPKLLTKFQPVLVFHPGEEFRPTTVESFIRDSDLEAATSPTTWTVVNPDPTASDLPVTSPPTWRLNQQPCFAGAAARRPPVLRRRGLRRAGRDRLRARRQGRQEHRPPVLALLLRQPLPLPVPAARRDLAVARGRLGGRQRRAHEPEASGRGRPERALLRRDPAVGGDRASRRPSDRVRGPRLARELLRARPPRVRAGSACRRRSSSSSSRPGCRSRPTSPRPAPPPGRSASASSRPGSRRSPTARRTGSRSRASGASWSTSAHRRRSAQSPSGRRPSAPRSTRSGASRSPRSAGGARTGDSGGRSKGARPSS